MDEKKIITLPTIGDYPSRKEWETACWKKISKSEKLLELLITSHERRDLVRRAAAVEGLTDGKSYRQIGRELWLSPQTISVISKSLKENGYRSYKERSKTERKKRIYSSSSVATRPRHKGKSVRTKYGTVHLPY